MGSLDEIKRDVETARHIGADEIILWPGFDTDELSLERYFELLELMPTLVEGRRLTDTRQELLLKTA